MYLIFLSNCPTAVRDGRPYHRGLPALNGQQTESVRPIFRRAFLTYSQKLTILAYLARNGSIRV